ALSTSSDLAWSAVALQLWADRVRVFNQAVDDIQADIAEARHSHYGARGKHGDPPTDDQIADARHDFMRDKRALYHYSVHLLITGGASQVATMLRNGVTPETLSWATGLGALSATPGAFTVFGARWHRTAMSMAATEAHDLARTFMRNANGKGDFDPDDLA